MIKSKLQIILAEKRLSHTELSKMTGVRQPTISALANNTAKHIPIDVLDKVCKALGCNVGDLFEYVEE